LLWVELALKMARHLCKIREGEAKLLESHSQLQRLSERLIILQDEEQDRISRELHDQLGQVLTAVGLDIDWESADARRRSPTVA